MVETFRWKFVLEHWHSQMATPLLGEPIPVDTLAMLHHVASLCLRIYLHVFWRVEILPVLIFLQVAGRLCMGGDQRYVWPRNWGLVQRVARWWWALWCWWCWRCWWWVMMTTIICIIMIMMPITLSAHVLERAEFSSRWWNTDSCYLSPQRSPKRSSPLILVTTKVFKTVSKTTAARTLGTVSLDPKLQIWFSGLWFWWWWWWWWWW